MTYDTYIEQTQNLIHNVLYLNEKRILPMSRMVQFDVVSKYDKLILVNQLVNIILLMTLMLYLSKVL
jgi:hypothetical protein